ncbi:amino acid transporter [Weizmannia acidilactici]|uniref:Amino acid transporter n=1 Tax=Weizmannia acidilactici TaxID=2607726 RepID=A0A5J4JLQ6_9BACI|nr:LysE family transporter [Weizmannia acidilactici]GER68477.1 amino acid transporter [Weizmannia acidilactici]GER71635.1 amino acid transporter [Weizmannia acidilactici]GER74970.1 amino acid transporter [Weizmannia acidilactici]
MESIISYIFLGLSLAAPIGPINAAQIDKGIKNGFFHSWLLGIGAMTADGCYMLLVYLGVVHLLSINFVKSFLWFFGCFVLTYTGIESMVAANQPITDDMRSREKLYKSFLTGFLMSLTNPLTILFWLGVYGSVLAKAAESVGPQQFLLYSCAIFIGVALWDFSMAAVSSSFGKLLTNRLIHLISKVSGLSLVGFGIYFGIQAVKSL